MIIINRFGTTNNAVTKGDSPGHPFRGNQYGAGSGAGSSAGTDASAAGAAGVSQAKSMMGDAQQMGKWKKGDIEREENEMKSSSQNKAVLRSKQHEEEANAAQRRAASDSDKAVAAQNKGREEEAQEYEKSSRVERMSSAISRTMAGAWGSVALALGASESDMIP